MKERVKKIRRYDGHRVNSARVCISVPKKLKKQMDKFLKDHPEEFTNWSRLASRAFRRFLEKKGAISAEEKTNPKTTR